MEILFIIVGLLAGAIVAYLYVSKSNNSKIEQLRYEASTAQASALSAENQIRQKTEELSFIKAESINLQERIIKLNAENARLQAEQSAVSQRLQEQKDEVEQLRERFNKEFRLIANELLEEKSKKFADANKENLDGILKPLREKLNEFEQKVELTHKDSIQFNAALRQQILDLKDLNLQMTKEANNLTKALKGDSKAQGNWGEFILESLLEKSGLVKDREYRIQVSMQSDDGRRLQPDVVIDLPDQKAIVVDAKVSLVAYERYVSTEDDQERLQSLREHLLSVKAHIKGLSEKSYQQLYQINSPDFVLLFIPIEPAFSLALQHDQYLFNEAYQRNIVIVSPSTLLATLRTIASIWKQEYQTKNVLEIARIGGDMYDKFHGFVSDLIDVGKKINDTQKGYESAMNKLVNGRGNLVRQAEKLKELGAKASKSLPENLLIRAREDGDAEI
jgi:DNA recombination protein RmuC